MAVDADAADVDEDGVVLGRLVELAGAGVEQERHLRVLGLAETVQFRSVRPGVTVPVDLAGVRTDLLAGRRIRGLRDERVWRMTVIISILGRIGRSTGGPRVRARVVRRDV
ncbi:hypothetical protein [Streptomyces iakyrus]|uniref:hypothetical protein n=1 Tax=Streptomyces iakyrus TaxID=68219 RepID=UPI0036FF7145